jgi:hypothetical protein
VYFDYKARQAQSGTDIATNLLKQLLGQVTVVPQELEALYTLYDESIRTNGRPDRTTLTDILTSCTHKFRIYGVFDALDECDECDQDEISSLLTHLEQSGFRLLISTRPHLNLGKEWGSTVLKFYTISAQKSDLKLYIAARLEKERNCSDTLKAGCLALIHGIQGM